MRHIFRVLPFFRRTAAARSQFPRPLHIMIFACTAAARLQFPRPLRIMVFALTAAAPLSVLHRVSLLSAYLKKYSQHFCSLGSRSAALRIEFSIDVSADDTPLLQLVHSRLRVTGNGCIIGKNTFRLHIRDFRSRHIFGIALNQHRDILFCDILQRIEFSVGTVGQSVFLSHAT